MKIFEKYQKLENFHSTFDLEKAQLQALAGFRVRHPAEKAHGGLDVRHGNRRPWVAERLPLQLAHGHDLPGCPGAEDVRPLELTGPVFILILFLTFG